MQATPSRRLTAGRSQQTVLLLVLACQPAACALPPPPPLAQAPAAVAPLPSPTLAAVPPPDRAQRLAAAGLPATPLADGSTQRVELADGVLFDSASDQPLPGAAAILQRLAGVMRAGGALTVLGHTDAIGSDAANIDLSARRARAVIALLAADGVDPSTMNAVAIGRRQPIASNATPEGRARNRRVEFLLGDTVAQTSAAVQTTGSGEVDLLRPDPAGGNALVAAGRIALAEPLAQPTAGTPAGGPQHRRPEAAPSLRIKQPEPVHRAPLADTPSY